MQKWFSHRKLSPMSHRAAHDLAKNVVPPFVAWDDTVANKERHGAEMISDHPQRNVRRFPFATRITVASVVGLFVSLSRLGRDGLDDRLEDIGVVIAELALHHRRDA